jgi:glycine/D-amino acid oxidase-like deaminating enzyme
MYFRPDAAGMTLLALEDQNRIGEDADGDPRYVAPDFVERAVDRLCRRMPGMRMGSLHSTHVGATDSLQTNTVFWRRWTEGFYLAAGFSGTGFKTAPAVGRCLAELILDGEAKTVDIAPFSLNRFAAGTPLRGEHPYGNIWR